MTPPPLVLALLQFAPRLRDPAANLRQIADAAEHTAADILLTPELAVTGYDLGDDASHMAVPVVTGAPLAMPESVRPLHAARTRVVLGLVERGEGGTMFNTAAVYHEGAVRFKHRKLYLPTYGMFDEGRFFGRGGELQPWEVGGGWRAGILVCEDFWHPGLAYALAAAGIQILLVLAAAPGRGVWRGGENGGLFASADAWERIARVTAQLYGIYVALSNRVGVEGGVTFAGGSLIVGPAGDVLARADGAGDALLEVDISMAEIERARTPYAHRRDDDPRLVCRLLRQHS